MLDLGDLCSGLLESPFMEFLAAEGGFGGWRIGLACRTWSGGRSREAKRSLTCFVCRNVLAGDGFLLGHLTLQMAFALLEHI